MNAKFNIKNFKIFSAVNAVFLIMDFAANALFFGERRACWTQQFLEYWDTSNPFSYNDKTQIVNFITQILKAICLKISTKFSPGQRHSFKNVFSVDKDRDVGLVQTTV